MHTLLILAFLMVRVTPGWREGGEGEEEGEFLANAHTHIKAGR
jgi:hypothetical protein